MKYTRFDVKYYKAIENITINLSKNVIPLIGINESGKTSILHAILAFDKDKDTLMDGLHIDAKNKYKTVQAECKLFAYVLFVDQAEFNEIGQEISLSMDSPLYTWLRTKFENREEICLSRDNKNNLFQKTYSLVGENEEILTSKKLSQLVNAIVKRLPNILYFDDFSDRVPDTICFSDSYIVDQKLGRGIEREWQQIIVEIFSRGIDEKFSLIDFFKLSNEDEQENYLSDVQDTLNREIIEEWRKLKQVYSGFGEDAEDLTLKIRHTHENSKHIFKFKVIDSENNDSKRLFDISSRSKGFQWYFNFIVKLKFNPKYKHHPTNAIYLLDEPGSYLHSSAQTELLKKLCEIGKDNKIIYCTHSQYLLDPEIINLSAIKIVSKDDGKIILEDYGNSIATRSLGAFSALNDALQLKFGFHENILRRCILTEGIVDYYFFKMFLDLKSTRIMPGAGCGQLKELISILISCSEHFVVILDYDGEGRNSYSTYKHYFEESFTKYAYQYEGLRNDTNDFVLEDVLDSYDIERLKTFTDCRNIKNAITTLFYSSADKVTEYKKLMTDNSIKSLEILKRKLCNIIGQKV
ncbi:AAA family ATPase [Oscillospiraceae bacterium WX1]